MYRLALLMKWTWRLILLVTFLTVRLPLLQNKLLLKLMRMMIRLLRTIAIK